MSNPSPIKRANRRLTASGKDTVAETQIKAKENINSEFTHMSEDVVYVHNISKAEFHVPPSSLDPKANLIEGVITFEVDECREFDRKEISTKNFLKCLNAGFLEVLSPTQYEEFQKSKALRRNKNENAITKTGLAASGLPANWKMAVDYVSKMEDIDELSALLDVEDRQVVAQAIEARIDELEGIGRED